MIDSITRPVWSRHEAIEDEVLLLGNILHSPREFQTATEIVAAEDFFKPENANIFRAFDALREDGITEITPTELKTKLVDLDAWPGDPDLENDLTNILLAVDASAFTGANARYYASRVKRMSSLRKKSIELGALHRACNEGSISEDELIVAIGKLTDENSADTSIRFRTLKEATHLYVDSLADESTHHFPSGITLLDEMIDGVAPGEMCVIAARPGHGKSLIAVQWLDYLSSVGVSSLLISREMQDTAIGARLLQSYATLTPSMWDKDTADILRAEVNRHHSNRATVFIADKCGQISKVERAIRTARNRYGVKVVAIDYMQLLSSNKQNRYEEVTDISQRLKNAAVDNNVAMLALCQMNREVEGRNSTQFMPSLSDLRESGQIEQDADIALFPQWPFKFKMQNAERWMYQIYCLKRRNGKIRNEDGKIELRFNEDRLRIEG